MPSMRERRLLGSRREPRIAADRASEPLSLLALLLLAGHERVLQGLCLRRIPTGSGARSPRICGAISLLNVPEMPSAAFRIPLPDTVNQAVVACSSRLGNSAQEREVARRRLPTGQAKSLSFDHHDVVSTTSTSERAWAARSFAVHTDRAPGQVEAVACGAHKFIRMVDWRFSTSRMPLVSFGRSVGHGRRRASRPPVAIGCALGFHVAAGIGAREYSRRSPPSLSTHITGPDLTTGSERAIGVRRSSPRWGRAWL